MKKYILLISFLAIQSFVFAQLNVNSDNYTNARISVGAQSYWAPLSIYTTAGTTNNEGVALAFEGTDDPEMGYRFKANGSNYYQVLYNGSSINWKHYEGGNYVSKMSLSNNGSLGIGVPNPNSKIDILSEAITGQENLIQLKVSDASGDYLKIKNATNSTSQFIPSIYGFHNSDNRQALYITGAIDISNDVGSQPITVFDSRISGGVVATRPLFAWDSYGNRKMILNSNGSLGIGTVTTGSHKLAVEGSIGAREIKVEASGWSDFVFENNYKLRTLEEVEQHINENGHLPEIPSEAEVTENGINLGEMNAKLLQKIEELTLYLIEQNKQNQIQQAEIEVLKSKISQLENE